MTSLRTGRRCSSTGRCMAHRTGVQNQRVLVAFAAPTDHPPGPGGAALRTDLMNRFGQAATYWQQATYNATTWQFEFTDWFNLHHDRRFYFWEQGDVNDARRALTEQAPSARRSRWPGRRCCLAPAPVWCRWTTRSRARSAFTPGVNLTAKATAIRVAGNRAYALAGAAGLHVIDVTNPLNPAQLGSAAAAGWGLGSTSPATPRWSPPGRAGCWCSTWPTRPRRRRSRRCPPTVGRARCGCGARQLW